MTTTDVIVVGLGGMGSATARDLSARGARVLGLERFTPAHDRGSSHGGSRIIRQSYFEDPAYVPLLLRAYELLAKAEQDSGADLLRLTGGLYMGPPDCPTVAGSLAAAREWDLPHDLLDADQAMDRFPTVRLAAGEVAMFEERAGYVRPEATVTAHLQLAERDGADLRFDQRVTGWTSDTAGVTVTTADGQTHHAGHLVLTPGAWAPQLLTDLGLPLTIERQVQHWFAPPGGFGPFVDHPIYISEIAEREQIYGFPAQDGPDGGVKVAYFRRGNEADPDHLDRSVSDQEIEQMRRRVATTLPGIAGPSVKAVACMYSTTADEHFVIAPHPSASHVTIGCGFSGHGFKFTTVVGEVLADLALDGSTAHPIHLFDPKRFL